MEKDWTWRDAEDQVLRFGHDPLQILLIAEWECKQAVVNRGGQKQVNNNKK